jgi:hypothetical protein
MKRKYDLMIRRFLLLIIAVLLAVTVLGCNDPNSIEANHKRLTYLAQQELQQGLSTSMFNLQAQTQFPAK